MASPKYMHGCPHHSIVTWHSFRGARFSQKATYSCVSIHITLIKTARCFRGPQVSSVQVVDARISSNFGFKDPIVHVDPAEVVSARGRSPRELLLRLLQNLREAYWNPIWNGNTAMLNEAGTEVVPEVQQQLLSALSVVRCDGVQGMQPTKGFA